ncbi:nitrogenase iron-iron accessory protein anfo [Lucifera butyrica]|uniref:Nitrogenase iron-iron accessory protein anfo n=1 Tax=Lucifera butyrica TaxID=1351585 RepID=A0A498RBE2_9FIRM|nr:Fe-only nitrogenase accessory AnfO family protein [Lucifera butyrica]VBB07453.1 nitrogenase iron-iron accessory protein anfo [Lucifera butyrica]
MSREIAVFTGGDGATASLYEPGTISIYKRQQGIWTITRAMPFGLDKERGLREMRDKMTEVLRFLENCSVFVALSVTGVPYYELEKGRVSVWEYEGIPAGFLDAVLAEEEASRQASQDEGKLCAVPVPQEIGPGHYQISIKEIQEGCSGITSKQVLLPLLRQGGFYQLDVVCKHLPPWLEGELLSGNLTGSLEKMDNQELKLKIARKTCCENR